MRFRRDGVKPMIMISMAKKQKCQVKRDQPKFFYHLDMLCLESDGEYES